MKVPKNTANVEHNTPIFGMPIINDSIINNKYPMNKWYSSVFLTKYLPVPSFDGIPQHAQVKSPNLEQASTKIINFTKSKKSEYVISYRCPIDATEMSSVKI